MMIVRMVGWWSGLHPASIACYITLHIDCPVAEPPCLIPVHARTTVVLHLLMLVAVIVLLTISLMRHELLAVLRAWQCMWNHWCQQQQCVEHYELDLHVVADPDRSVTRTVTGCGLVW